MPLTLRVRSTGPQVTVDVLPTPQGARLGQAPSATAATVEAARPAAQSPAQPATAALARPASPAAPQVSVSTAALPQPAVPAPAVLQPGRTLTVQVLEELPGGRAVVEMNGTRLEAVTGEAFPAGSAVRVRVQQLHPEVVLRALGPPTASIETASAVLRQNLPAVPAGEAVRVVLAEAGPAPASQPVEALVNRLKALLPEGQPPAAEKLAEFVRDGGVQYEAKLAAAVKHGTAGAEVAEAARHDVKGLVLEALAEHAGAAPRQEAALGQHLRSIEAQQAANLLAAARGDPVLVQVPLMLGGGQATTLHLAVQPDGERGRGGETPEGFGLLMHLDLDGLGSVRIDAQLAPAGTRVVFYVERAEGREQMRAELPALREALEGIGGPVLLQVRDLRDLPAEKRPAFQALAYGLPQSGSSLDLRA
jgi:hypothetical protein